MELCTHEKAVFFLSVNILMVWLPVFLAAQHTTVCLDPKIMLIDFSFCSWSLGFQDAGVISFARIIL